MKMLNNMWGNSDKDISDSLAYKTLEYAENGNIKEFKKAYKELSKEYFGADFLQNGYYKLLGYTLDFRPFLKRYLVQFKYYDWYVVRYALNKTNIYDNMYINKSQIEDIVEDTRHITKI